MLIRPSNQGIHAASAARRTATRNEVQPTRSVAANKSRALVVVPDKDSRALVANSHQGGKLGRDIRYRNSAGLVSQLIATKLDLPQTRNRRKTTQRDALQKYQASLNRGVDKPKGVSLKKSV